ncbi:Uncharacterised protein [Mycobacteroides abscessus subsp. abscessus]|nr:Uncharacterised protein [Mycobacteroides abscessus subsp. abscessus]
MALDDGSDMPRIHVRFVVLGEVLKLGVEL